MQARSPAAPVSPAYSLLSQDHGKLRHILDTVTPGMVFASSAAYAKAIQAVVPGMKARKAGHIVNIGSIFGSINFAYFVTYSSSKAGLKGFILFLQRRPQGRFCLGIHHFSPINFSTSTTNLSTSRAASAPPRPN